LDPGCNGKTVQLRVYKAREQGTGIVGAARSDEPVGTENMAKFSSSLGFSPANPTLSEDSEL
jgi:hypothetical protein